MPLPLSHYTTRAVAKHGNRFDYRGMPEPRGCQVKYTFTCRAHGEFQTTWNNHISAGGGCRACKAEATSARSKGTKESFVERSVAKYGERFDFSQFVYTGSKGVSTIVCPDHGAFQQHPENHLNSKHGCPKCGKRTQGKYVFLGHFVEKARAVHGDRYEYLGEHESDDVKQQYLIRCPDHGEFTQRGNNHLCGAGCPKCWSGTSKWEVEIAGILEGWGLEVQVNQRILGLREIDVWVPSLQLGIELHGLHWHSDRSVSKDAHLEKLRRAQEKGWQLIQVFEDEWKTRRTQVLAVLRRRLGLDKRVQGRKCQLRSLTAAQAGEFHTLHHLKGARGGAVRLGLEHEGQLVAVATFGASRFRAGWELVRYSTSCVVLGGLAKLVKAFFAQTDATALHSYCDLRWFTGGSYRSAGFALDGQSAPGYDWTDGYSRVSRFEFQRHRLAARVGRLLRDDETEDSVVRGLGFHKIYDCGNLRFSIGRA